MPQALTLEEFDARYGQPTPAPRTLTLEQFEARESLPPIPRRKPTIPRLKPELTETIEGLPDPATVVSTKPMVDLREGGPSFERTITVTEQGLNAGRPTNVPTIWDGQQLSDDQAVTWAIRSGARFPSYDTIDEAVQVARQRSRALGQAAGMTGRQPRALTLEQFEAREAAPAAPSLARSALHGVVQGAAGGVAGFPEQVGIAAQRRPRWLLEQYGRIDQGEPPQSRQEAHDWATTPEIVFYSNAAPEARQRLREEAGAAIRPIAEEPAYQVGQSIRESTAGAFPVAPEHEGRFPVQLGRGLGSTATFLGTGLVGRLFRLPALPVVAGTGAVANSAETFRDAIDRGASFEDAFTASRMAGVVGTSEAVPIVKLLDRLDDASGGQIRRLIIRAAQGGIEEGAQEIFQSVAENLIASELVAYDPERGTFQGSGDAAGVGFTVGALMNFLASMLGAKMRRSPQQVTEETVREFKEHVIREPEAVPTPSGRPAERGEPFERPEAPAVPGVPTGEAPTAPGAFPGVTIGGRELTFEQARVLSRAEKLPDAPFLVFDTRTVTDFEGIFPTVKEAEAFIDASQNGRFLDFGTPRQIEESNSSGPESAEFMLQHIKEVIGREFVANEPQAVTEAPQFAPETPPAPPKGKHRTLAAYLQKKGGLNDVGGDVRAALDRRNIMPGLINKNITYKDPLKIRQTSKRGMGLDDAASDAQQDGWFPELRHRTAEPADLIDALRREQAGEILDHPDNAEYIRYQEDSRAFEESEYARERAFDAEIERQVEALEYDTADFPGYIEGTPPVPTRLTEEAGLVGGRPEEAARVDPDARAGGAAAVQTLTPREIPEWAQVTSLLPRLPDGTIKISTIDALFDVLPSGKTRWSDLTDAEKITVFDSAKTSSQPTTEQTEQGEQTVLPGAERISDRALAERRMEQPLRPGAAPMPADEGLFDVAGRGQGDLVDLARQEAGAPEGPYSGLTPALPRFAQATGIERPKGRYAGSINLDKLDTPEAIKRAIGFVSKQEGGFKEARRGTISWQETEELAADLGLTVQKLRSRRLGQAFNAEQIEAARTLHLASAENLHLLAKKATESGAYEDVLAFDKAYHQHVAIQAEIEGSATEAGRALNIHRKLAAAARGEKAEYIKEIIQSTGGRASMEELMGHIASLDAEGVGRYVQKAKKSTRMEKLREAWYMALLSDVTTQGVNIGSNAVVSLWTVPEHAVSGVIGKLHGGEKVYLREVFGRVYGVLQGAKTGLRMAYNAWESEVPSDLLSKVETQRMKAIPSVRFRKGKVKKRIGRVRVPLTGELEIGGKQLRIPGRALLAGDEFFKAIGYSQKLHELAIRDGIQKGKRGAELLRHVQQIKRDVPEGMHSQARRAARVQTFTEPLGKAGQAVMNLRERTGMAGWVVAPFLRTPVNIFKFSMKRTPVPLLFSKGEVREQIRAGGAERDIALGRIAFGSGIMTLIASYAASGLITGAGPDDPGEKAVLRTTGWQPYSFKVGNEYYSYFYYEPLGSLFGIAADFSEIRDKYPEIAREEEWDRLAAMIVGSMTNNLTNKTYLRGLSEAIRAVDDPSVAGERWIRGLSGTLIPTGIAGTARRGDPILRDARSILDNFKSRIPGLRETLPPRLDPFGREIRNEGALGPDIASRIYRSTGTPDLVVEEMLRLKVTPGRPKRILGGVKLGPEQYVEFVQLWRQSAKKELDILVNAPGWGDIPDHEQRRMIRNAFSAWRDMAVKSMFKSYPELLRTQTRQRLEAVTR